MIESASGDTEGLINFVLLVDMGSFKKKTCNSRLGSSILAVVKVDDNDSYGATDGPRITYFFDQLINVLRQT